MHHSEQLHHGTNHVLAGDVPLASGDQDDIVNVNNEILHLHGAIQHPV